MTAINVSARAWRITGKPVIYLLDHDGNRAPAPHVVNTIGRTRDWVVVAPGEAAHADVSWSGWDGRIESTAVLIEWPGGCKKCVTTGPRHPTAPPHFNRPADTTMNTSSDWWSITS